ncbi:hypothetical protein ACHAQJ_000797 [Trichoderma viride]
MSSLDEPTFRKQEALAMSSNGTRLRSDNDTDQLSKAAKRQKTTSDDIIHTARFQPEDYTVSWICALHIEMAAACAVLDRTHRDLPGAPNNTNTYTLGNIGCHNIVITCLPAGDDGTNNAATVASNIEKRFPSINIHLMVGIGGGAPGKLDLRLGDVVVGSRVMQYDLGKINGDGQIERSGFSRIPPSNLLTYIIKLRAIHEATPTRVPSILQEMHNGHPAMTKYAHPNSQDRLFRADYDHNPAAISCDGCDESMLVHRLPRTNLYPKIHYEAIASSNQVMKHGITRDKIAQELEVACFEMEAAGLMNFPYLLIRGVCDYSDSHKNEEWQEYAAAVAAAYAKEFLDTIPISGGKAAAVHNTECRTDEESLQNRRNSFLNFLKFEQIDSRQSNIKAAYTTTCKWFLKSPEYLDWIDSKKLGDHRGFLWLSGKPGAGKSTIMKFAYTRMKRTLHVGDAAVSFFFNARGDDLERSTTGMYRSLLLQLLERFSDLEQICDDANFTPDNDSCPPTLDVIQTLFRKAISMLGQRSLTCFIDAVDECDELQVRDMVTFFEELGQQAIKDRIELRICFSSRHYPYIFIRHGLRLTLEDQKGHEDDVEKYLQGSLRAGPGPLAKEVQAQIIQKAAGVFMWAVLVVDILNKEFSRGGIFAVKKRLADIPDRLGDLFKNILKRDNEHSEDLLLCLQWILYAKRPLQREEFYFAVSSGLLGEDEDPIECLTTPISSDFMDKFVISSSKGLAEVTKSKHHTVQFIHESVRDFLIKDNGLQELWPELTCNFESLSHDKLRQCCHLYLQGDFSACLLNNEAFPQENDKVKKLRDLASEKFPFFRYATQHVLYHANLAASSISQDDFLAGFMLEDWIVFNNLFEMFKVRRYTTLASLFYILADKGFPALIRTHLRHNPDSCIMGERYQYPLFAASINRHNDAVEALLEQYPCSTCDEDVTDDPEHEQDLPIYRDHAYFPWAILNGHQAVIQLLVEKGADINAKDSFGRTALFIAARKCRYAIARLLIEKGADINAKDDEGRTALWAAAIYKHEAIIELFIEKGADINAKDNQAQTVLWVTSTFKHRAIIELLAAKGADMNAKDNNGQTALFEASRHGEHDIMKLLIQKGADINAKDNNGRTALWIASKCGHKAVIGLLVENGIDINAKDDHNQTVLLDAIWRENEDIAGVLIEKGADINIKNRNGHTALWVAFEYQQWAIMQLFINKGADINTRDNGGKIVLSFILQNWWPTPMIQDISRLLIEKGADINAKDNHMRTPLLEAVWRLHKPTMELLVEKGADINATDDNRWTPLLEACWHRNMDVIEFLVEKGADINAKGSDGRTALLLILHSEPRYSMTKSIARFLIEKGADIHAKDNDGRTALQEASTNEHEDIVKLLIEKGADSTGFEGIIVTD